jgi:hypothetical protein
MKNVNVVLCSFSGARVDIELWGHHDHGGRVFWGTEGNSYVCLANDGYGDIFLDGKKVQVVSINGAGEVRWATTNKASLRSGEGLEAAEAWGLIEPNPLDEISRLYEEGKTENYVNDNGWGYYHPKKVFKIHEVTGDHRDARKNQTFWSIVESPEGGFMKADRKVKLVQIGYSGEILRSVLSSDELTHLSEMAAEHFDLGDVLRRVGDLGGAWRNPGSLEGSVFRAKGLGKRTRRINGWYGYCYRA